MEQVALVPIDHPQPTIRLHYSDLMSVVEGARGGEAEELGWAELGLRAAGNSPDPTLPRTLEVAARPLSDVLDRHQIEHYEKLGPLCSHELDGHSWQDVLYRVRGSTRR